MSSPPPQTWFLATYGLYADVHKSIETDKDVAEVHANTELFDPRAEHVFTYLQVPGWMGCPDGLRSRFLQHVCVAPLPERTC